MGSDANRTQSESDRTRQFDIGGFGSFGRSEIWGRCTYAVRVYEAVGRASGGHTAPHLRRRASAGRQAAFGGGRARETNTGGRDDASARSDSA